MDEHPANSMIIEKAKAKGSRIRERDSRPLENGKFLADRRPLKRKRSATDLEINIQHESDMEVDGRSLSGHSRESSESPRHKEKTKGPVGVTVIDDEEEEVQLGMQKAMRAPRYFTKRSFAGSSKKCFNCGQQGHFNRDCPNARQEKPCFLCAKFGHQDFRCPASKVRCYKCNRLGHLSRECPYPQNSLAIPMVCTKCGHPDCAASGEPDWVRAEGGCTRPYAKADLDVIRCFVCNRKGHLSCKKTTAALAHPSCFNCGRKGHLGTECPETTTYLASVEKREASNQRGLEELRGNSSGGEHREAKRQRRDLSSSSYWQASPPGPSPRSAAPATASQLNRDAERYLYPTLPPVQHPKLPPSHPAYQTAAAQPGFAHPGQGYGQAQYPHMPLTSFGQSLAVGGFTMGYVPPPQPNHGQRSFPRNGRRR